MPCDLNSLIDLSRVVDFQFSFFLVLRTGVIISKCLTCLSRKPVVDSGFIVQVMSVGKCCV